VRSFVEQLKQRLLLSSVVSQHVRLVKRGRDFWGPCPFHKEQTPSFVVHDDKGRYHCFGCGADGDLIHFVESIRNVSFREAVAELSEKAGLPLPEESQQNRQEREVHGIFHQVLQTSKAWFQSQLSSTLGGAARDYLASRLVLPEVASQFELGWAPYHQNALGAFLTSQGIESRLQETVGVVFASEGKKEGRDRFRGRLIFPIHDDKGRVIGFGGRSLGGQEPKYLNSPETPVFLKNKTLYGLWQSKKNPHLISKPVVLVEGYLDVISLQAGHIARALAPLGTALGEDQLLKAWRLSATLLVCFDGDSAGEAAAYRTALRALPLLKPGYSLEFCQLPLGEDPQSLMAGGQQDVILKILASPKALVDFLWENLQQSHSLKTPEAQAAFKKQYGDWCQEIKDKEVRHLYLRAFEGRFYQETRSQKFFKKAALSPPTPFPRKVLLEKTKQGLQIKILLLTLLRHPSLIGEFEQSLENLGIPFENLDLMRWAILHWWQERALDLSVETINLIGCLEERGLGKEGVALMRSSEVRLHASFTREEASIQEARLGFQDVLSHYQREVSLKYEIEEAQATFARGMHEKAWRRLQKLKEIYAQLS
jgi:DNA primase